MQKMILLLKFIVSTLHYTCKLLHYHVWH